MILETRRAARAPWLLLLAGCTTLAASPAGPDAIAAGAADAAAGIRPEVVSAHIRFLADDLLEGRAPGERGFDIAAAYVASQLLGMGLEPARKVTGWNQVPSLPAASARHGSRSAPRAARPGPWFPNRISSPAPRWERGWRT